MISDCDIRRTAAALVADYGIDQARAEAQRRCREMLVQRDPLGFASWKVVVFAVEEAILRPRLV